MPYLCIPEVFGLSQEEFEGMNVGDLEFQFDLFISLLKEGQSPFKEDGKTKPQLLVEFLEGLGEQGEGRNGSTGLNLEEQRLKELPLGLFNIKNTEVLILNKNPFTSIPEELGKLINLKELHLREKRLETLPESIGKLENLEVLNLAFCSHLKSLPESIGNLKNLKKLSLSQYKGDDIPDSVSELPNLEEFVIVSTHIIEDGEIVGLPEWVFKFKGLKRLCYKLNDLTEKDLNRLLELSPDVDISF
ncbi:MAG: Leucine-rich repeat (LRR) protein [Bacteroidia bacterium]